MAVHSVFVLGSIFVQCIWCTEGKKELVCISSNYYSDQPNTIHDYCILCRRVCTRALSAREETGLRPVDRSTRPKGNRPAAGGQVHRRFASERKPACGRWAGTQALRARKETGLLASDIAFMTLLLSSPQGVAGIKMADLFPFSPLNQAALLAVLPSALSSSALSSSALSSSALFNPLGFNVSLSAILP